ncbi:MAG: hypothetical protein Q4G67_00080 [Actinomycetia bacterium]|nr:hypothetical protein [Actinomycetes bacterium]
MSSPAAAVRGTEQRWRRSVAPALAIIQAVIVLGPALGPGIVIRYDMAWSPDPRWTDFVLGWDTPAPRAVPSDAAAVLLGTVTGASAAQSIILTAILAAVGVGAARLLTILDPGIGAAGQSAAVTAAVWNPFVHERLLVGHWTVLLALAILPWALGAVVRLARDGTGGPALYACLVLAGAGGANTVVVVGIAILPTLLVAAIRTAEARPALGWTLLITLGMSAVWAAPALTAGAVATSDSVEAFSPVPDSPLGVVASVLSGGGFWNEATHPSSRQVWVVAVGALILMLAGAAALAWRLRPSDRPVILLGLIVPITLVVLSATPQLQGLWSSVVTGIPGGGLLRDSHKLSAAWVLLSAVGLGVLSDAAIRRCSGRAGPLVGLVILAPIALNPLLAWGAAGQLAAVTVPPEYRSAVASVNALPPGDIGLVPWNQYRRYGWNSDRVSLTLFPRLVDRTVVYNDELPLRSGTIPGESERAAAIEAQRSTGDSDVAALVSSNEVRYIAIERDSMGGHQEIDLAALPSTSSVVVDEAALLVIDLGPTERAGASRAMPVLVGWSLTLSTTLAVGFGLAWRRALRV